MEWMGAVALAVVTGLSGAFAALWTQVIRLQKENITCKEEQAILKAEMKIVKAELEVQKRYKDAIVVLDSGGHIKEWSPGATLLFNWAQRDALGKHVTVLMPERFRDKFKKSFDELVTSKAYPLHGPHYWPCLTASGEEVNSIMLYHAYQDSECNMFYVATIRFDPDARSHASSNP